jgi:hypothetical protein
VADAFAAERQHAAFVHQRQDHRTPGEALGGSGQATEVTAAFNVLLTPEIADDVLFDPAVLTDGLAQVDAR